MSVSSRGWMLYRYFIHNVRITSVRYSSTTMQQCSGHYKSHYDWIRGFTVNFSSSKRDLDSITYDKVSDETLDELATYFEDLGDSGVCHSNYDVQFSSGVLTIALGGKLGTFVINKQSPNKQIWLSSPLSGPKRYDIIDDRWRYHHDNSCLHDLLAQEISQLLNTKIDLSKLQFFTIPQNIE